jgi:predicted permease
VCFGAVVPLFLVMALGYLAQQLGAIHRDEVGRWNKVAFRYFMPALMFYNIYASDITRAIQPKVLLFAVGGVLLEFAAATVFVVLTEQAPERRGVKIQGMFRSNFVIIGLPLAMSLLKGADMGPVAILMAVIVPMFNVLAVIVLEVFRGNRPPLGRLLRDIGKNPLILGSVVGVVFLLLHWRLPAPIENAVAQIAQMGSPLMLFLLGAFFRFDGLRRYRRDLIQVTLVRLVIAPGLLLTAAYFLGIRDVVFAGLIGVFASATAANSFTMSQQMGGDAELAGDIVVVTSALCLFTMFGWSLLFRLLGAF